MISNSILVNTSVNFILFLNKQRGDSLDTIFASSPPPDCERQRVKSKTKKRNSPRKRRQMEQQESTDQETIESNVHLPLRRHTANMIIDECTGNIAQLPDSVILNIESSDTSSSDQVEEDDDYDEDEEIIEEGNVSPFIQN